MIGVVLWGVNNIYTVLADSRRWQCRLKGKYLKDAGDSYNPLSPGDRVDFEPHGGDQGMITCRLPRKNAFQRWNRKRNAPQTVAANLDRLFCITSPDNPPFRPRFIDRALVTALRSEIPFWVVLNKIDLEPVDTVWERLEVYRRMGVPVLSCSAKDGKGIEKLREEIHNRVCGFIGQSGVGKSAILNRLDPQGRRRIGEVSAKYNRGSHTTVYAVMHPLEGGGLVDTPGIREIEVFDLEPQDLIFYFADLLPYREKCGINTCLHREEPACAVRRAAETGSVHPDRYNSYLRILDSLQRDMVV